MRISDWSSDVCSSDLRSGASRQKAGDRLEPDDRRVSQDDLDRRPGSIRNAAPETLRRRREMPDSQNTDRHDQDRNGTRAIVVAGRGLHTRALEPPRSALLRSRPLSLRRSEEHTSELQSLMRISYAVFC